MTTTLKHGHYCLAIDGKICREALAPEGAGVLCSKHLRRISSGETVTLTAQARADDKISLKKLHKKFAPKGAKPVQATSTAGEKFELNLVSLSIISALVTVYSGLVVFVQARAFDMPLGLAVSGFNAPAVAIQSIPHAFIMLLFAIALLVLLLFASGVLVLLTAGFSRLVAKLIQTTWRIVQVAQLLVWLPTVLITMSGRPVWRPISTTQAGLIRFAGLFRAGSKWVAEFERSMSRRLRQALFAPFRMVFLGMGQPRRVVLMRTAAIFLLLSSAISLAGMNARDLDRQIHRIAAGCASLSTHETCGEIPRHWVLDPVDSYLGALDPEPITWPISPDTSWRVMVADAAAWLPNAGQHLLRLAREGLSFEPALGTFAYAPSQGGLLASHILAKPETITARSFRTEDLFLIADFGQWALVARREDVGQRVLVRRAALAEFSESSKLVNPSKSTFKAQAEAEVQAQLSDQAAQLDTLQAALDTAKKEIERLRGVGGSSDPVQLTHTTAVSVIPFVQSVVQNQTGEQGGGPRIRDATLRGGGMRPLGVFDDLVRTYGPDVIESCRRYGRTLAAISFDEGEMRWAAGQIPAAFDEAVAALQVHAATSEAEHVHLVLLEGGASYTGSPATNLSLSEARAEWVKAQLLAALVPEPSVDPVQMGRALQALKRINLVAFGLGERLESEGHVGREVVVRICPQPSQAEPARAADLALQDAPASDKDVMFQELSWR